MQNKKEIRQEETTLDEFIEIIIDSLGELTNQYELDEEYFTKFKFFTPYENIVDFGYTVSSPVLATLILTMGTCFVGVLAVLAPVAFLASLVVFVIAAFFDEEFAYDALGWAGASGKAFIELTYLTVLLALTTALEFLGRSCSIFTRLGATVVDLVCGEENDFEAPAMGS